MTADVRALRPYAPLLVLLATIGVGWMVFIRPVSADQRRAASQLQSLREREMALRREIEQPSPHGVDVDPAATFERQVASGNVSPAVLEQLAQLASTARARNLLIETVEAGQIALPRPAARPAEGGHSAAQRDPRFALFDTPVSHVPIRVAFDIDYANLGRFLWAFRNLPTTVEIRTLSVGVLPATSGDEADSIRTDILRAALTLYAYSRSAPDLVQAVAR